MKQMLHFDHGRRLSKDVDFSKEFEMIFTLLNGWRSDGDEERGEMWRKLKDKLVTCDAFSTSEDGVVAFLSLLLVYQSLNDLNGLTNLQG